MVRANRPLPTEVYSEENENGQGYQEDQGYRRGAYGGDQVGPIRCQI